MRPTEFIRDFRGLVGTVLDSVSKRKLAARLSHDRQTINRWADGTCAPETDEGYATFIREALRAGVDIRPFQRFPSLYDLAGPTGTRRVAPPKPPDLRWLISVQQPPKFSVSVCGITAPSPVGVAASPLMGDHEWAGCMLGLGYGLSTFRTRRNTPSAPWPPPHLAFVLQAPDFDHYDAENPPEVPVDFNPPAPDAIPSLVNSLGLPSESPTGWREEYRRIQAIDPQRLVGLSIAPEGRDGLAALVDLDEVIRQTLDLAPPFVEVNLITPNLTADLPVVDPAFIATLCERARAALGRSPVKLFAKIPHLPDPLLAAVFEAVAPLVDAFVFRNSVLVRPVICDKKLGHLPAFPGRPAAGLSGPCTFETTRDKVRQLVQVKKEKRFACALVAIGGVTDPTQAIELFNDGVDAVQVCTAAFFDPFLAWKMRCAFSRALPQGHIDDDRRKIPRDDIEVDSFENAVTARQQLRSRGRELSDDAFRKHWNDWMRHRPDTATDRAARIEGPRSVAEWIKVFTV